MLKKTLFLVIVSFIAFHYAKAQTGTSWLNYISQEDSSATFIPGNSFFVDSFGSCYSGFNYYGTISMGNISVTPSNATKSWNDFAFFRVMASTGNAIWARKSSNLKNTDLIGIAPDGQSGLFALGVTLDNSLTLGGKSLNTNTNGSLFLAVYDSSGNLKNLIGLAENITTSGLAFLSTQLLNDKTEHAYISSSFTGTVQFDTFVRSASSTNQDIFLAKYDSFGTAIWLNTDLNATSAQVQAIASDSKGNIYISGEFYGDLYLHNQDIFHNLSLFGAADAFIAKYDSTGKLLWVGHISGPSTESLTSISTDASDNVYGTGTYSGEVEIGTDIVNGVTYGSYICKFNSNGDFSWLQDIKTEGKIYPSSFSFSKNDLIFGCEFDKNVIINQDTLTYNGTEKNANYAFNSVVIKYDTSGHAQNYLQVKSDKAAMLGYVLNYNNNLYGMGSYVNDMSVNNDNISTPGQTNLFMFKTSDEFSAIAPTNKNSELFKTYPNPTYGNIYFSTDIDGTIEVHDIMGRMVLTAFAKQNENNTLNLNGMDAGVYILSLCTDNGYYYQKIVKR